MRTNALELISHVFTFPGIGIDPEPVQYQTRRDT